MTEIIVCFAVGFITATLGAIKDSPHEGFKPIIFWRSPVVCCLWGIVAHFIFTGANLILIATFSSTCERISVETYKAIIKKKPGKFDWGTNRDRGWLSKWFW